MTTLLTASTTATETSSEAPPVTPATARAQSGRRIFPRWVPAVLAFLVIIGVWYFITYVVLDPQLRFLLPPPDQVFTKGFFDPQVLGEIGLALVRTMGVTFTGLAIAIVIGIVWAVAMSQAKWIEESLFPYAVILQCIPILALVPLIGFWFGFEFNSRVIVTVLIALFPMVSNTLFGLQSVDVGQRELFQLHKASRWTVLRKLEFPSALPAIFAGMRISAGLAVIGAIVGDFFFRRGQPGIGSLINIYTSRALSAELFAAVITASLLGVAIFVVFGLVGKLAVGRWHETGK